MRSQSVLVLDVKISDFNMQTRLSDDKLTPQKCRTFQK